MHHSICFMVACAWLASAVPLAANPTNEDPTALLAVFSDEASELLLEARVVDSQATEDLSQYEVNLRDGIYKAGESRTLAKIGGTSLAIVRLDRLASRLQIMGEPAGADLRLRAQSLRARLQVVVDKYRTLPKAAELIGATTGPLQTLSTAKARTLGAIGTLFKQGKVEAAEKRLYETTFDEFEPALVWHGSDVASRVVGPFLGAKEAIDKSMLEIRRSAAAENLARLRTENAPQFRQIQERVAAAIKSVESTGKAEWDGQQLEGPELLLAIHHTWRSAQIKTMRCRAIDWARGIRNNLRPPSELDSIEAEYLQFDANMVASVESLLVADAGRLLPDVVPAMYGRYLAVLAELTPAVASQNWNVSVERGLAVLRNRSPQFAKQVEAYDQATADVLRWRRRAAQAAATSRAKTTLDLQQLLSKAATPESMVERRPPGAKPNVTYLSSPAPQLIRDVAAVTMKQPVTINQLASDSINATQSRYRQRAGANTIKLSISANGQAQFKEDLFVTPTTPALTLVTATAIKSAEQGTLLAVGGEIIGVELQSMIVPFMKLDEQDASIRLGPFPEDPAMFDPGTQLDQVRYQFAIKPEWLQHEYIFQQDAVR